MKNIRVPTIFDPQSDFIEFALTYNAYEILDKDLNELTRMFSTEVAYFSLTGQVREGLTVAELRAWLFTLARQDYFSGGSEWSGETSRLWISIIERIRKLSDGLL